MRALGLQLYQWAVSGPGHHKKVPRALFLGLSETSVRPELAADLYTAGVIGRFARRKGSAGLLAVACYSSGVARAEEPLDSQIQVVRTREAADCPDAPELRRNVSALGTAPTQPVEPVRVEVTFERTREGYGATLRSFGAKPGLRRLVTAGKTCSSLADAVGVALVVLLDLVPPTDKAPVVSSRTAAPRDERSGPPFVLSVGVRAGVGYGELGDGVSGVFSATASLSRARFQLSGSAFWHTHRHPTLGDGSVELGLWGGGLDACYRFGQSAGIGWFPCVGLRLGSLSGRGEEFDQNYEAAQTWAALAAGGRVQLPLSKKWAFVAGLSAMVPLRQHSFSAASVGTAVETGPFGLLLEMGPEITIW
jgi:hypothetical protein